jgi:hypothetical protein
MMVQVFDAGAYMVHNATKFAKQGNLRTNVFKPRPLKATQHTLGTPPVDAGHRCESPRWRAGTAADEETGSPVVGSLHFCP